MEEERRAKPNTIAFRVDDDAYTRIQLLSEYRNQTPSEIVRDIVNQYLFEDDLDISSEEQKLEYINKRYRGLIQRQEEEIKYAQLKIIEMKAAVKGNEEQLERIRRQRKKPAK
jgi:predicted DNA-binding protein